MGVDADIHAALMARVATMTGFTIAYPGQRTNPAGEYVEVRHLPNDNERIALGSTHEMARPGILQLTLCSEIGQYEVVYKQRAGTIADYFPMDLELDGTDFTARVYRVDIGQGMADGEYWRTPISVYYRAFA